MSTLSSEPHSSTCHPTRIRAAALLVFLAVLVVALFSPSTSPSPSSSSLMAAVPPDDGAISENVTQKRKGASSWFRKWSDVSGGLGTDQTDTFHARILRSLFAAPAVFGFSLESGNKTDLLESAARSSREMKNDTSILIAEHSREDDLLFLFHYFRATGLNDTGCTNSNATLRSGSTTKKTKKKKMKSVSLKPLPVLGVVELPAVVVAKKTHHHAPLLTLDSAVACAKLCLATPKCHAFTASVPRQEDNAADVIFATSNWCAMLSARGTTTTPMSSKRQQKNRADTKDSTSTNQSSSTGLGMKWQAFTRATVPTVAVATTATGETPHFCNRVQTSTFLELPIGSQPENNSEEDVLFTQRIERFFEENMNNGAHTVYFFSVKEFVLSKKRRVLLHRKATQNAWLETRSTPMPTSSPQSGENSSTLAGTSLALSSSPQSSPSILSRFTKVDTVSVRHHTDLFEGGRQYPAPFPPPTDEPSSLDDTNNNTSNPPTLFAETVSIKRGAALAAKRKYMHEFDGTFSLWVPPAAEKLWAADKRRNKKKDGKTRNLLAPFQKGKSKKEGVESGDVANTNFSLNSTAKVCSALCWDMMAPRSSATTMAATRRGSSLFATMPFAKSSLSCVGFSVESYTTSIVDDDDVNFVGGDGVKTLKTVQRCVFALQRGAVRRTVDEKRKHPTTGITNGRSSGGGSPSPSVSKSLPSRAPLPTEWKLKGTVTYLAPNFFKREPTKSTRASFSSSPLPEESSFREKQRQQFSDMAVGVLSAPKYVATRLQLAARTWLQNIDTVVYLEENEAAITAADAFTSSFAAATPPPISFAYLPEPEEGPVKSYNGAWKNLLILTHLWKRFGSAGNSESNDTATGPPAFKRWFIVADDDTFMLLDNLQISLHTFYDEFCGGAERDGANPCQIGSTHRAIKNILFVQGGGGIVLNRGGVQQMVDAMPQCEAACIHGWPYGDMRMGCCAHVANVSTLQSDGFWMKEMNDAVGFSSGRQKAENETKRNKKEVDVGSEAVPRRHVASMFPISFHRYRTRESEQSAEMLSALNTVFRQHGAEIFRQLLSTSAKNSEELAALEKDIVSAIREKMPKNKEASINVDVDGNNVTNNALLPPLLLAKEAQKSSPRITDLFSQWWNTVAMERLRRTAAAAATGSNATILPNRDATQELDELQQRSFDAIPLPWDLLLRLVDL